MQRDLVLDRLVEIPQNPPPAGADVQTIVTDDGAKLRAAAWLGGEAQRGTVLLLGGRAEFIEKYFETIGDLRARGFSVLALDWRGQGGSERLLSNQWRGHIDDFDQYLRDMQAALALMDRLASPRPYYLLGHSTGGAVALLAAAQGTDAFARIIVTAPLVRLAAVRLPGLARLMVKGLDLIGLGGRFLPGGSPRPPNEDPFEGNILTSDARRFARNAAVLAAEPRLAIGDPSIGWVGAAFSAMRRMEAADFGVRNHTPLLMVLAGADALVSTPTAAALAQRMRSAGAVTLPGARHEILMERNDIRAQFFAAFDAFIPGTGEKTDTTN